MARHHQIGFVPASTGKVRPATWMRDGRKLEFDVPARFGATDSAAALSAGLDGMGVIALVEFVASHYLTSSAQVHVLPGWQCQSLPLHLVTRTIRKRVARVQASMGWAHALLLRRLGPQPDAR